jgi:hypothetical protein
MPSAIEVGASLTTPGTAPFSIFVGPYDLTNQVPLDTVHLEDNGSEVGTISFDVVDMGLAAAITDGATIRIEENGSVIKTRFVGEVTGRSPIVNATGRFIQITGRHIAYVLDRSIVPADSRVGDATSYGFTGAYLESDRNRIQYLMGVYGERLGTRDASQIAQLRACGTGATHGIYQSGADDFPNGTDLQPARFLGLTLRQAIEQVAAQANGAGTYVAIGMKQATYYIDAAGRLHYFDATTVGDAGAAPYAIRIGTPGGGEIAPEDLLIHYDSTEVVNAYYVKGANAAGSGWVTDQASILTYGRREDYIDAPDADTAAKRNAVGNAALADTRNPITRGSFTVKSPYTGWTSGQILTINSAPQFNISAPTTFQIVAVSTTFLDGTGTREFDVQFGGTRASMFRTLQT